MTEADRFRFRVTQRVQLGEIRHRMRQSHGCKNDGKKRVQVLVRDNNVDQALKALKKKMQREGIFREMKLRGHYEKPSEKRAREKAEAVRRARKLARKRAQREGLLPSKAPRR
ncbi:ribosomal protein S21 [Stappia sp. ES.058]|nr:ribosomal protein S21 [Stappia sp. ES.058]